MHSRVILLSRRKRKAILTGLPGKGSNRRLEFELGAWFEGACGFALVLALSQMMEHGLGPFGRADLHPRRNPLDRQGRFAPQPSKQVSPIDTIQVLMLAGWWGRQTAHQVSSGRFTT
jgi:hypothetical protein